MNVCAMRFAWALSVVAAGAVEHGHSAKVSGNPVRKVITMLQALQAKVEAEGEEEKAVFQKFMCYCKTEIDRLEELVVEGKEKAPGLSSGIEAHSGKLTQVNDELKQHKGDRAAAKAAVGEATQVREKEKTAFDKFVAEANTNLGALSKAVAALEKGTMGFLQTSSAAVLQALALSKMQLFEADRQDLLSFLSGGQGMGYMPASSEIQGILKQMRDEIAKDLSDATAKEKEGVASYADLMAAKRRESDAITALIEEKQSRSGELLVAIEIMKGDLNDVEDGLKRNTRALGDLRRGCSRKNDSHNAVAKERGDELLALAESIKMLNDDNASNLFSKALLETQPSPSFLQLQSTAYASKARALAAVATVDGSGWGSARVDSALLAFGGATMSSKQVAAVVDKFISELQIEQKVDDEKNAYCIKEFDLSHDKRKELKKSLKDMETAIDDSDERVSSIKEDMDNLRSEIQDLDESVAEATGQRKKEHEDFAALLASNEAAKQLIGFAKNRLNKFYNPKLYRAPVNATVVDGVDGTSGTAFVAENKPDAAGSVMAMLDLLMRDLDREAQKAELTERDAQQDYEAMLASFSEKRAEDAKTLTHKEGALAQLESSNSEIRAEKLSHVKDLSATIAYRVSIHSDCDRLLKLSDTRRAARAGEIEALRKAKAVLHGAKLGN